MVGDVGLARQRDGDDVLGLVIVKRSKHEIVQGLDAAGRRYLVSTGRYALRGIGRAQDLYTLDPEVDASEPVTGSYERYLAN